MKWLSFEDFAFLTMGPLEQGVHYKTDFVNSEYKINRNDVRDSNISEYKKALKLIIGYPEFNEWNKNPEIQVSKNFVKEILGEKCLLVTYKPKGYLYALYRVKMFYKIWIFQNTQKIKKRNPFSTCNVKKR